MKSEERFDGRYVLRTNTTLPAKEVALRYKKLWQVERIFREVKGVLEIRPVHHKYVYTYLGLQLFITLQRVNFYDKLIIAY